MNEIRQHKFDGIEEYDNPLPRWWLYLFYFTIAFSVVYAVVYPTTWFYEGTGGWSSAKQYEDQMAEALKSFPALAGAGAGDPRTLLGDPAALAAGKETYGKFCAACHGKDGEGRVGPSFQDTVWKFGAENVVESIGKGRPGGMPPWGKALKPDQLLQVSAYVLSLSQGAGGAEAPPPAASPAATGASPAPAASPSQNG